MRSLLSLSIFLSVVPASAGVYAHYSFDTDYSDSSGNDRHGTYVDGGTTGDSGIVATPDSFKFGGGAMNFGTNRTQINIPAKTFSSGVPYTIAFWAKKEPGDIGDRAIWDMVIGERNTTNFFIALGDSSGSTGLRWRSTSDAQNRQADFSIPRDHHWHHYTIVAAGGVIALYLDGSLFDIASGKLTGFTLNTIGEAYTTNRNFGFHGQIDEMWIFDEALDSQAITNLHQSNDPAVAPSTASRVRVFLLGGQSNADGRAAVTELPPEQQLPSPGIDFYYKVEGATALLKTLRPGVSETSQFGPEISFGRRLADLYSHEEDTRVAIIKYANGGTNLHTQWKAGGDETTTGDGLEYKVFQQTVIDGLAALSAAHPQARIDLEGMIWMQGEADAAANSSTSYQTNLAGFISDLRKTFGESLPFIIGRLSSGQTAIPPQHLTLVRSAQESVATEDPLTTILDTDGFGMKSDNLHFNGAGQLSMGKGFAAEAAYLAWMRENFSAEEISTGSGDPGADPDGDGHSNRAEFIAETRPNSGDSSIYASFTMPDQMEGNISYATSRSRSYTVEKYSEEDRTWKTELPALRGSGETASRPLSTTQPAGIYRVRIELP